MAMYDAQNILYTPDTTQLNLERSHARDSDAMMSEQLTADSFPFVAILDRISRIEEMVAALPGLTR